MDIKTEQSKLIKTLRQRQGLTQKQLAERSGLGLSSIKELETDVRMAKVETLFKLAEGLDITPMLLFMPLWDAWRGESTTLEALSKHSKTK